MEQENVTKDISVTWRWKKYVLNMNLDATLEELGQELQKLTAVKSDTLKLIVQSHKSSKLLSPFSDEHSHLKLQETSIIENHGEEISLRLRTDDLKGFRKYQRIKKTLFIKKFEYLSTKLMYVNLKYQMGNETLHAYFATCNEDGWMMIELCRFIPYKKDVNFKVLIESMSRYYCGSGAIYVEGIHFLAINDATLKVNQPKVYEKLQGVQRTLKSNSDSMHQVVDDYHEIRQLHDGEKVSYDTLFFLLRKRLSNMYQMLPAKKVLYESSEVKCFKCISLSKSRFLEAVELLPRQVIWIKYNIETQKLLPNVNYICHLVFELPRKCHGLQCPVKVRDLLLRKKKEFEVIYFRSPRLINFHGNETVPKVRSDGLMEVIVWKFNSGNELNDDHLPMNLKLICYEGTMSGLILYGIEFRPTT